MRIGLVTPAPPGSHHGNRVTAMRWASILAGLGHRVTVAERYGGEPFDLLVALHARRSAPSVRAFRAARPGAPIVVALTGTDLYRDVATSAAARRSLELADRLVALQPRALDELEPRHREKTRVVYQSVEAPRAPARRRAPASFDVCVVGHLRAVKDPFRAAMAARLAPAASRLRVLHAGRAMTPAMERRAVAEAARNPRYRWLGDLPRARVWRLLGESRACVLSSRLEGGANVVGEAVVAGTPLVASRIPGSVGLLGDDYPGLFPAGDTRALAAGLWRAETDAAFLAELRERCARLAPLFDPRREVDSWRDLLAELIR